MDRPKISDEWTPQERLQLIEWIVEQVDVHDLSPRNVHALLKAIYRLCSKSADSLNVNDFLRNDRIMELISREGR